MTKVKLDDLLEAMQLGGDMVEWVVDLQSGEVTMLIDDILCAAEDEDDDNNDTSMEDYLKVAKRYMERPEDFIVVPSDDFNEYDLMMDFAEQQEDQHTREKLAIALQGKGAFRRFKDTVKYLGLDDSWYIRLNEAHKRFILAWVEDEGLELMS